MRSASIASFLGRARNGCAAGSILLASLALVAASEAPASEVSPDLDGARIKHALPRGVSSFIIDLAVPGGQRSVTFVNENIAAQGKLSIAVSDRRLTADSPLWINVAGPITFRHKRLFTLSLVGIEANYVRLTFDVDGPTKIATR